MREKEIESCKTLEMIEIVGCEIFNWTNFKNQERNCNEKVEVEGITKVASETKFSLYKLDTDKQTQNKWVKKDTKWI